MTSSDDTPSDRLGFLRTLTMLATLTAASEVRHGIRERRAGRDPSMQEASGVVIPFLLEAGEELGTLLLQIRSGLVISVVEGDDVVVAPTRHMLIVLRFNHVTRLLQRVHQRLMSLYPRVDEDLVEEARQLHARSQTMLDDELEAGYEELVVWIDRLLDFTVRMERTVRGFRTT